MPDLRTLIPATPKRTHYASYVKDCCPFHQDQKPSFLIWSHRYKCFACGKEGTTWNGQVGTKDENYNTVVPSAPRNVTSLPFEIALQYSSMLGEHGVQYFQAKRGLTESTIRQFLLGYGCPPDWQIPRYTIPIIEGRELINIKFRRDDVTEVDQGQKYIGWAGHNYPILWGASGVNNASAVIVVAGELDRIIAYQEFLPRLYPVTSTGGENTWKSEWARPLSTAEKVYVCLDSDRAGQVSQERVCKALRDAHLFPIPVSLPSDTKDITEFIMMKGAPAFYELLPSSARIWVMDNTLENR